MWPYSPANPCLPRCSLPPATRPPPMPVPSVTSTMSVAPLPAPYSHSDAAAHVASLSTWTFCPTRSPSSPATSKSATPSRLGAARRTPSWVTSPGTPTPSSSYGPSTSASSASVSISLGRLPGPRGVGRRSSATTVPEASSATPRHFVPPTSMPTVRPAGALMSCLGVRLHLFDRVEDPALGAALDEAGERDDELDRQVVLHERAAVVGRLEAIGALDRALDVALDHRPSEHVGGVRVVVLQGVVRAATERRGAELDLARPPVVVAGGDDDVFHVARPFGVALDVGCDRPHGVGRGRDRDRV